MKKALVVLSLLAAAALWNLLFPPGLQTGRNTIYFVWSARAFTFYVSRPDASWVPRPGFARESPFPLVEHGVTFERLHSYKAAER